jgi:hypothetical protein
MGRYFCVSTRVRHRLQTGKLGLWGLAIAIGMRSLVIEAIIWAEMLMFGTCLWGGFFSHFIAFHAL